MLSLECTLLARKFTLHTGALLLVRLCQLGDRGLVLCLQAGYLSTKLIDLIASICSHHLDLLLEALNLLLQCLNLHLEHLLCLLRLPPTILQLKLELRNALLQLVTLSVLVREILHELTLRALKLSFKTRDFDFQPLATLL